MSNLLTTENLRNHEKKGQVRKGAKIVYLLVNEIGRSKKSKWYSGEICGNSKTKNWFSVKFTTFKLTCLFEKKGFNRIQDTIKGGWCFEDENENDIYNQQFLESVPAQDSKKRTKKTTIKDEQPPKKKSRSPSPDMNEDETARSDNNINWVTLPPRFPPDESIIFHDPNDRTKSLELLKKQLDDRSTYKDLFR